MKAKTLISLVGPTAIGKTTVGINIAEELNIEIISADSRQFYKELAIGTAKPTLDEQAKVKHHFVDNKSISQDYNASHFEKDVIEFLSPYFQHKDSVVLVGGSGMYIDAILKGFDENLPTSNPEIRDQLLKELDEQGIEYLQEKLKKLDPIFYEEVDLNNSKRLMRAIEVCLLTNQPYSSIRQGKKKERDFSTIKIGLEMDRKELYHRINCRVDQMMADGLLDEVKSVVEYREQNALKTVGYRELFSYLDGECTLDFAIEKIKVNSRRYAKRQLTWFKRDLDIEWFRPKQKAEISKYIRKRIASL